MTKKKDPEKKEIPEHRIPVQANIPPALFGAVERKRGLTKRSTYITHVLEKELMPEKHSVEA